MAHIHYKKKTKEDLQKEEKKATRKSWIKFSIVITLYLLFLLWVKSWWGLLVVPFIFDAYITKKIRWTWWKDLESPVARTVMSWVDAIIFALVAVYFVNNFFFQNYKIPSSSLEKSLLTGDYLLVSKLSYGPRIPQTPLTMPLTQHTLPFFNCKSYFEWPHWEYRRVSGLGKVELNDIVVFNFPAGDTVAVNTPNTYYTLCFDAGASIVAQQTGQTPTLQGLNTQQQMQRCQELMNIGKEYVKANEQEFGEVVSRPTDRRECYVKRCVGLPGQMFQIKDKKIYVDGKPIKEPDKVQFNYYVYLRDGQYLPDELCQELEISDEDRQRQYDRPDALDPSRQLGMPLTHNAKAELLKHKELVDSIVEVNDMRPTLYPIDHYTGWTEDNYGPLWIPAKGSTVKLDMDNIAIYERPIRSYEGNTLDIKGGKIYINGKETTSYTFKMDYYWMMGDNRHNSADSRFWGFVPEDHVIGKPLFIWWSVSPDSNPKNRIRWSRLFSVVDNIK